MKRHIFCIILLCQILINKYNTAQRSHNKEHIHNVAIGLDVTLEQKKIIYVMHIKYIIYILTVFIRNRELMRSN